MPLPTTRNVDRTRARSFGYDVLFNDRYFRIVNTEEMATVIETAPAQPPRVDTESDPGDFLPEHGQVFSQSDFSGGEGLAFFHRPDRTDADRTRFWDSRGVDVELREPGRTQDIRLLNRTTQILEDSDVGFMVEADGALYVTSGTDVRRTEEPIAGSPAWTTEDPHDSKPATDVEDLVAVGEEVYAALGNNGVHVRNEAGTWSEYFGGEDLQPALRIWSVKGRLLVSTGRLLWELEQAATGTPELSLLHSLPPGDEWTSVTDGGIAILGAATDRHLYAWQIDDFQLTLTARTKIKEEVPVALGQSQGIVMYAVTSDTPAGGVLSRLYAAELNLHGDVVGAELIRQWGDEDITHDTSPMHIMGTRDSMFVGVNEGNEATLWRYDIVTGGRTRNLLAKVPGRIPSILTRSHRLFFTVEGQGVFRESEQLESTGYLISSLADFFSAAPRVWTGIRVNHDPLTTGAHEIRVFVSTVPAAIRDPEHPSWRRVKRIRSGAVDTETPLAQLKSRYLAVKIELDSDGTTSPRLRSFAVRAFPPTANELIVRLPINVSDQLERRGVRATRAAGHGTKVLRSLMELEGENTDLTLLSIRRNGVSRLRGTVEEVGTPVLATTRRGSPVFVSQVTFRGVIRTEAGETTATGALGVGTLGIMHLGGPDTESPGDND